MRQTGSAPPPHTGAAPAAGPAAPARRPAAAVLVLALVMVLADALALALQLVPSASMPMQYLVQGFFLVLLLVGVLFSAAVLWLLVAARGEDRCAATLPLAALALVTLAALLNPLAQLLALGLQPLGVGGDGTAGYEARHLLTSVVSTGGGILLTLGVAAIALRVLLRPRSLERTTRVRVGPTGAALLLIVISLLAAAATPVQVAVLAAVNSAGGPVLTVSELLLVGRGVCAALLLPAAGLLLVHTAERLRTLIWVGLGLYWLAQLLGAVLMRVQVIRSLASMEAPGPGLVLAHGAVLTIGALLPAVAAGIVLLLRTRPLRPQR